MIEEIIQFNGENYKIKNPLEVIKTFCVLDPSYEKYDMAEIRDDHWLEDCADACNKGMRIRLSKEIIKELIQQQKEIEVVLHKHEDLIKNSIINISLDGNEEKLKEIFRCFKIKGIQNTIISKILHRRFQNFFPIVDREVGNFYKEKYKPDDIENLIEIIKLIKKDLEVDWPTLKLFRKQLGEENIKLTELRLFDHLIWIKIQKRGNILFKKVG